MSSTLTPPTPGCGLVRRAGAGDENAWRELVELYDHELRAFVLPSGLDVDEVVQRAWSQAHRDLPRLAEPEAFRAWLWRITRHELYDARRRRQRENARTVLLPPTADLLDRAVVLEDALVLEDAVDASADAMLSVLPARQRRIVTERVLEGRAPEEVADRLGLALSTVYSEFSRGISRLRTTARSAQAVFVPWLAIRTVRRRDLLVPGSEAVVAIAAALIMLPAPNAATEHTTGIGTPGTEPSTTSEVAHPDPRRAEVNGAVAVPSVPVGRPLSAADSVAWAPTLPQDNAYETVADVPSVVGVGRDSGDVEADGEADVVVTDPAGGQVHVWIWDTAEVEPPAPMERVEIG